MEINQVMKGEVNVLQLSCDRKIPYRNSNVPHRNAKNHTEMQKTTQKCKKPHRNAIVLHRNVKTNAEI